MKKIVFLIISGSCLCFSLLICYRLLWPLDSQGKKQLIDVPPGKTFYQLSNDLEERHIIRSSLDMKILIKLFNQPPLPKGEYELSPEKSLWSLFQTLKQGQEKSFLISFPEGFNYYEMAELLKSSNWPAADDFLKEVGNKKLIKTILNKDLNSFEGYLFPDTYSLKKYMSAQTLIKLMTERFLEVYDELSSLPLEVKFSRHQVVTFASLIEKETGQPKERPLIAGVFYNRLNLNMKLQTDPTILYALYLVKGFNIQKNIRKKDILFPSSYNTYVVKGLPPGPIANPGKESLKAVFMPEKSDYLYFVSKNDGSHTFSKTYKEHEKAVYKYQIKAVK